MGVTTLRILQVALPWLAFFLLLILAAVSMQWGSQNAIEDSADLLRRAEEVQLFLNHVSPYQDPDCTYPPSALPVFAAILGPFDPSELPQAYLVVNLLALSGILAWVVSVYGRSWRDPSTLCLLAWCLSCRPVRAGMALGQFHLIPLALALGSMVCLGSGRKVAAGILLGIALIKPTMVYPLVLAWVFMGQWRALCVALGLQALLALVSSAWLGESMPALILDWLHQARAQMEAGTLDLPTLVGEIWSGTQVRLATTVLMAILSAGLMWNVRLGTLAEQTALALILAAMGTYHRHYDLVLLMPAILVLLVGDGSREGQPWWLDPARFFSLALALLLIVPTNPIWLRDYAPFINGTIAVLSYVVAGILFWKCSPDRDKTGKGILWPGNTRFVDLVKSAAMVGQSLAQAFRF